MTIDITKLVLGILEVIFAVVGIFLVPWLKEKFGAEKLAKITDSQS